LTARDPAFAAGKATVMFEDDGGNVHEVPLRDTISREQGLRALRCWMPRAEKWSELVWGPA
jgi:hypothetical protein